MASDCDFDSDMSFEYGREFRATPFNWHAFNYVRCSCSRLVTHGHGQRGVQGGVAGGAVSQRSAGMQSASITGTLLYLSP